MIYPVQITSPQLPSPGKKEILRYAGAPLLDEEGEKLLQACLEESRGVIQPKVCYAVLPLSVQEDLVETDAFTVRSRDLARNMKDAERMIVFAATVGVGIDRLIAKYSRISSARALFFQAIGSERVEALCDVFCENIAREWKIDLFPRFSPGYGDLDLSVQKDVFALLNCTKRLGVVLGDSLLMTPSKSVTAFAGFRS